MAANDDDDVGKSYTHKDNWTTIVSRRAVGKHSEQWKESSSWEIMLVWIVTSSAKGEDEGGGGDDDESPTAAEWDTWSCEEWPTGRGTASVVVADEMEADDKWRHKRCFLASIKALRRI